MKTTLLLMRQPSIIFFYPYWEIVVGFQGATSSLTLAHNPCHRRASPHAIAPAWCCSPMSLSCTDRLRDLLVIVPSSAGITRVNHRSRCVIEVAQEQISILKDNRINVLPCVLPTP